MKILLIKPDSLNVYRKFSNVTPESPPLGLAYIAAVLEENNYEVKILDLSVEKFSYKNLISFISNYSPDIIGFTSTTPLIDNVYFITKKLKELFPNIYFISGGPHSTALPGESLDYFDFVVRGEAEYSFLELVKKIETNKTKKSDLKSIGGLSFKLKEKKYHNPPSQFILNLDKIPFPARHLLPMRKYHYPGTKRSPETTILTTRGCPFRCIYCNKNILGYKLRLRSIENVTEEIKLLVDDFKIKELLISDDTFSTNRKFAEDVSKSIIKEGFDLSIFTHNGIRVDSLNSNLLKIMRKAGFYSLIFGIESGNREVLRNANKYIDYNKAIELIKICRKLNFETTENFILGLPGETEKTIYDSINFAIKSNPTYAKFFILVPYPGTKVYDYYEDRINVNKWSEFCLYSKPVFNPKNISAKRLMHLYKIAFRKFYFRPAKMFEILKINLTSKQKIIDLFKITKSVLNISR